MLLFSKFQPKNIIISGFLPKNSEYWNDVFKRLANSMEKKLFHFVLTVNRK